MEFQAAVERIENLLIDVSQGVATIAIDRPQRKNAMSGAMWEALRRVVSDLGERPGLRAVILRGNGADFCAGADIGEFDTLRRDPESARRYEASNSAAFAALRLCRVPTIAAIRGICMGGGFGMAAACDIRIAAPEAIFAVPAARLGLAYPVDAMADIVQAVGPQVAKYLVYSAARIGADEALRLGFLLEVVDEERFDERIAALARTIAANAPLTIAATKASIRAVLSGQPDDTDHAIALGDATFSSRDYEEGRAAFAARRAPRFEGR
jgi:enoyl-CoA hydratase/carnithine racemase